MTPIGIFSIALIIAIIGLCTGLSMSKSPKEENIIDSQKVGNLLVVTAIIIIIFIMFIINSINSELIKACFDNNVILSSYYEQAYEDLAVEKYRTTLKGKQDE